MNNFNLIAPCYELLKKVVFGNKLEKAERCYLNRLKEGDQVLIIGGGNGDLLNHLSPQCTIDYMELSGKMISNAVKQGFEGTINFIEDDFLRHDLDQKYDWVITNFFLDVFDENHLRIASKKIFDLLKDDGKLLATDFYPTNQFTGKLLLKLMHVFFKLVSNLESRRLKNIPYFLQKVGFRECESRFFAGKKIFSIIFSKDGNL